MAQDYSKQIDAASLWADIEAIRARAPLIHNITNYVVMQATADALLALGASPVMAHAGEEMEEMGAISSALVLNIGTLSKLWIASMHKALERAKKHAIPVVLDPVGVGASALRRDTSFALIKSGPPSIIKGNASEIAVLAAYSNTQSKGVDSLLASGDVVAPARRLAEKMGTIIVVTGKQDYVFGAEKSARIDHGHAIMGRVTGTGCTLAALTGAFAAVNADYFIASVHAAALAGIAGEIAAENSRGPGSFRSAFHDAFYSIDRETLDQFLNITMF